MNNLKVLASGIIKNNPTFVLVLGMCPTPGYDDFGGERFRYGRGDDGRADSVEPGHLTD